MRGILQVVLECSFTFSRVYFTLFDVSLVWRVGRKMSLALGGNGIIMFSMPYRVAMIYAIVTEIL